jgi:hypothetical protein
VAYKVFDFDQTRRRNLFHIWLPAEKPQGGIMAVPKNDKHKDYARYAAHCLGFTREITDQDDRAINREMATKWLKLADAIIEQSKPYPK